MKGCSVILLVLTAFLSVSLCQTPAPAPPPPPFGSAIGRIDFEGVPAKEHARLLKETGLRVGAALTEALWNSARRKLQDEKPPLGLVLSRDVPSRDGANSLNVRIRPR